MSPIKLNHIGIAVKNSEPLQKLFQLLGMEISQTELVPSQAVLTHFIPFESAGEGHLELLVPDGESGPIQKFLTSRGEGIHHLSFKVETGHLDKLQKKLTDAGFRLIYPVAQLGAQNMRVNFIHPASCSGVLIEIMESSTEENS